MERITYGALNNCLTMVSQKKKKKSGKEKEEGLTMVFSDVI